MRDLDKDAEEAGDWSFLSHDRVCELLDEKCAELATLRHAVAEAIDWLGDAGKSAPAAEQSWAVANNLARALEKVGT
jgi:hypothetical protein